MMHAVTLILAPGIGTLVDIETFYALLHFNVQKHTTPDGAIYACIRLGSSEKGRRIYLHRWLTNCPEGMEADHRNRKPLDNRIVNLRICMHRQNTKNTSKRRHSKQLYKGVVKTKRGWNVRISVDNVKISSPSVHHPELAAGIYDALSVQHHQEFGSLNLPSLSSEEYSELLEYAGYVEDIKGIVRERSGKFSIKKERNGKMHCLGTYKTLREAIGAGRRWQREQDENHSERTRQ